MNIFTVNRNPKRQPQVCRRSFRPGLIALGLLLCCAGPVLSQDIHYSQFYNAPFLINPGLTGVFDGDTRFTSNFRRQWFSATADYQTFTATVDHRFIGRRLDKQDPEAGGGRRGGYFAGGLSFNFDQAGDSRLTYLNLGLNGSYTRKLSPHFFATLGAQLGGVQRRFHMDDLLFDNHYDEALGRVDPGRGSGELFGDRPTLNFFDFSSGINFHWQAMRDDELADVWAKRHRVDFGLGIFHLNRPNQSFDGASFPITMRFSPYVAAAVQVHRAFDIMGLFSAQIQNPYHEMVGGLAGIYHLKRDLNDRIAIQLGVMGRFNTQRADAYSPVVELHYNNWRVGFSYDVNVSEFNVATNRRSGPEFSLRHVIRSVKLPAFKICPML